MAADDVDDLDDDGEGGGHREATLAECIRLLSSDSRERKFVGMLLVTRLLPRALAASSDDDQDEFAAAAARRDEVLSAVANADGFGPFVTSMLRAAPRIEHPRTSSDDAARPDGRHSVEDAASTETTAARAAQATASHALALATCAALARCEAAALDDAMAERLPLFAAAMSRRGRYAGLPDDAVSDACEAAALVIRAGGEEAAERAAEVGVTAAAARALAEAAGGDGDSRGSGGGEAGREGEGAGGVETDRGGCGPAVLPAAQLLAALLESPAASAAVNSGGDRREPTCPTGHPNGSSASHSQHSTASKNKAARAVANAVPAMARVLAILPGQPAQIEALRCLALTLSTLPARRPDGDLAAALVRLVRNSSVSPAQTTAGGGAGAGWLANLRGGLASVLRARAPREMRLAALDLCAAAADLAGPLWLCEDDLGEAEAHLSRSGPTVGSASRGEWRTSSSSSSSTKTPSPPFYRLVLELTRVETAVTLHDLTREDAELRGRARAFLPVPLVVYERLVAALAADTAAGEDADAGERADDSTGSKPGAGSSSTHTPAGSLLSAEAAQAAVVALADVAGSLLEFLEDAADRAGGSADHAGEPGDALADPAAVLAVVRALGAFLAELPDAHGSRINALLPRLLAPASRGGLVPSQAMRALLIRFTLPYVVQATEEPSGLDAFAAAEGPEAMAFLMERCVNGIGAGEDGGEEAAAEATGVVAAACAALRNAMAGAEAGIVGVEVADAAATAFVSVLPALASWAARRLGKGPDGASGRVSGHLSGDGHFLRGLATAGSGEELLSRGGWRGVHELLDALVPDGEDGERARELAGALAYAAGGGTGWMDGEDDPLVD